MNKARGFWDGIPLDAMTGGSTLGDPKFSPSGQYLAYLLTSFGNTNLHYYDLKSGTHYQLTDGIKLSTGTAYGGKTYEWLADSSGVVFSEKGQLYTLSIDGGPPEKIQSVDKSFSPATSSGKIAFVVEQEDKMSLAIVSKNDQTFSWPQRLDIDASFIYDPVFHPSQDIIALHKWDFPNMSWNGSEIHLYDLDTNQLRHVAGSEEIETSQPRFSPDGTYLSFLSEETGWRNVWMAQADGSEPHVLVDEPIEHSYSVWVSGSGYHEWIDDRRIIFTRINQGLFTLAVVDVETGAIWELPLPTGEFSKLTSDKEGNVAVLYQNYKTVSQLLYFNVDQLLNHNKHLILINGGLKLDRWSDLLVQPQIIETKTRNGDKTYGLYYCLGEAQNPPLLMLVHGGPTGMSRGNFVRNAQYFASRGWAVFDFNYRGSIGYGKEYRQKMNGAWGIIETDDCIDALKDLDAKGLADLDKAVIMGGSAGGFTVLSALSRYPGTFKAGVDLFGVSELFLLAEETHYLESRYTDSLIGPLPEAAAKYHDQSPLYHAENITDPLLILQGADDPVVPPNQSELIRDKVQGPVELKMYEGEGHGFKKKSTIDDMYERIEKFLRRHVLYK